MACGTGPTRSASPACSAVFASVLGPTRSGAGLVWPDIFESIVAFEGSVQWTMSNGKVLTA